MLVGIVKKKRDHDDRLCLGAARARPCRRPRAIFKACLIRFRPIMMTTMAALVGTLPIALGIGAAR